jgi:hypothetical protein
MQLNNYEIEKLDHQTLNIDFAEQSLEEFMIGLPEIYDSHLDFDQAVINDELTRSENKSNFECRVCMKIPKKIFVCSNEDCCIPFCQECSYKIINNS